MPRRDPDREMLDELGRVAADPHGDEARALLEKALRGKRSLPAARAAKIAGEAGLVALIPLLDAAFSRFRIKPEKNDKQCKAKIAIAEALDKLDGDPAVFLDGARSVQMEASWGEPVDTAAPLRTICALALARRDHPERYRVCADLLFDAWSDARIGGARAASAAGGEAAEALLRAKCRAGDEAAVVIGECIGGLLAIAPEASAELVQELLARGEEELVEQVALAVGESRLPDAFAWLQSAWENGITEEKRAALLMPLALLRSDDAFAFLLRVLRHEGRETAARVLEVMQLCRVNDRQGRQIEEVLQARGDVIRSG